MFYIIQRTLGYAVHFCTVKITPIGGGGGGSPSGWLRSDGGAWLRSDGSSWLRSDS